MRSEKIGDYNQQIIKDCEERIADCKYIEYVLLTSNEIDWSKEAQNLFNKPKL